MKLTLTLIGLLLALTATASGNINDGPDHSLLWNGFRSVTVADSFVVLTHETGVVVCHQSHATGMYEPVNHLALSSAPQKRKLYGEVLSVYSVVGILYFIDLSELPDIRLLGQADLGFEIQDWVVQGDDLYVCAGFDGLFRYSLSDYQSPQFLDSSMLGVNYVGVETDGTHLFAVDNYNGILTYDLSGGGFGRFEHILYMPFRARQLVVSDTDVAIMTVHNDILLSQLSDTGLVVTDTADARFVPGAVFLADSLVFALAGNSQWYDLIYRNSDEQLTGVLPERMSTELQGDLIEIDGSPHVILPSATGGLHLIDLEELPLTTGVTAVYDRPGPIRVAFFHEGTLYTGGVRNPLDAYSIDLDGKPTFETTVFPGLTNVRSASLQGDSLFVLYPQIEGIFLLEITPDEFEFHTMIEIDSNLSVGVKFTDSRIGDLRSLIGLGTSHLDFYIFSAEIDITKLDILVTLTSVLDVEIIDSLLVFSDNKFGLSIYRIYDNFSLEYRSTLSAGSRIQNLIVLPPDSANSLGRRLVAFGGRQMRLINLDDPSQPAVEQTETIPISVAESVVEDGLLYAVGTEGIGIFEIDQPLPNLVDHGGRGGHVLTVENGIAAVSDGSVLYLYDLRSYATSESPAPVAEVLDLYDLVNYPNPFNPATTVSYELATAAQVQLSVYNLLGQEVTTLVSEYQEAGLHTAHWTGWDDRNRPVASGVYFCRLKVGDDYVTRKMVFIK